MPGLLTYDEEARIAARVHAPEINAELYGKTTIELMQLGQWLPLSDTTAHYARLAFHFARLALREKPVLALYELDENKEAIAVYFFCRALHRAQFAIRNSDMICAHEVTTDAIPGTVCDECGAPINAQA